MNHPNYSLPFELQTDASERAVGSVLLQKDKIIGFHSAKLSNAQRVYTIVEKELYGILLTLENFKPIIYGFPVIVMTDNRNLTIETISPKRDGNAGKSCSKNITFQ